MRQIPLTAPAGSLVMLVPPATATPSLIKVVSGNPITFSWSLSGVSSTPSSLTVQAYCSQNSFTYTLGTIPGSQPSILWDPYAYEQGVNAQPLAQASYTMRFFDERGLAAAPSPGVLSPQVGPQFALYHPAPYTPLADWTCTNCLNGVGMLRALDSLVLGILATSVAVLAGSWSVLSRIDW